VLTSTLRSLVADGLVTREVFAETPPRVEYALTELGRSLQEPVAALRRWAEANVAAISENRDRRAAEVQVRTDRDCGRGCKGLSRGRGPQRRRRSRSGYLRSDIREEGSNRDCCS